MKSQDDKTAKGDPKRDSSRLGTRLNDLARQKRPSLALEFWYFLKYNKKWWLLPILVTLLLLCLLVLLGGSGAAVFIYPLF